MVLGVGADILHHKRIKTIFESPGKAIFIEKVYTQREIQQADTRPIPIVYYANRFAAKEAVFKSLNIENNIVSLKEIEILNDCMGMPVVSLSGKMADTTAAKGINEIKISLSNDGDYSIAYAISLAKQEDYL